MPIPIHSVNNTGYNLQGEEIEQSWLASQDEEFSFADYYVENTNSSDIWSRIAGVASGIAFLALGGYIAYKKSPRFKKWWDGLFASETDGDMDNNGTIC